MDKSQEELIPGLIGWAPIAVVCLNLYLARRKGRSTVIWLFLPLFFNVFGTVMLLLIKPEEEEAIQQDASQLQR